jgi:hypothetical protein
VKTRQHFHWNVRVELRFMARPVLSQSSRDCGCSAKKLGQSCAAAIPERSQQDRRISQAPPFRRRYAFEFRHPRYKWPDCDPDGEWIGS